MKQCSCITLLILFSFNRCLSFSSKEDLKVVIARFNEAVDHLMWLKHIPHVLYNRGDELLNNAFNERMHYENVGRESFLYLNYILKNYHNLPKYIIFTQAKQRPEVYNFTDEDFRHTVEHFLHRNKQLSPENDGFAYLLPRCFNFEFGVKTWGFAKDNFFKTLLNFEVKNPRFGPTGCFIVSRDLVLRNTKNYYSTLIKTLSKENNPRIGHFFERAWSSVFHSNCTSSIKNYYCHIGNLITPECEIYT